MKINEIADVAVHPAVKAEQEFVNLLQAGEDRMHDMIAFVMDDRNADARRLHILRRIDELLDDVKDSYDASDLDDFMHDQGELSDEEADAIDREMGVFPYHLKPVEEETFSSDADIPTGEYEICDKCFGDGCEKCEGGLIDVTGTFQVPKFEDFDQLTLPNQSVIMSEQE